MSNRHRLVAALLCAAAVFPLQAADCLPVIESGWIRKPPTDMPMMAGFAEIRNPCGTPVSIVAAASPAFASVELHETRRVDGVSRMRHVEFLEVAAQGRATLAPGGFHLMLMRPTGVIALGDAIELQLELADGRMLSGSFQVRAPNAL